MDISPHEDQPQSVNIVAPWFTIGEQNLRAVHRKPVDTDRPEEGGPFAILRLTILVRLGGRRRDLSQPNPDVWGILDRMAFFGALLASPFPCSLGLATQKRTSPV